MTGNYQFTVAQERIADLRREADRERLAATDKQTTRTKRPSRLLQISRRLARPSTT